MKIIARKIKKNLVLKLYLAVGIVMMVAALIVLPIAVFSTDVSLLKNGFVWGFVLIEMLAFGLVGWFCFLNPFLLFRRLPEVQAETDGTYLYIHSTKEAKIPLADMEGAYLDMETPYIMTHEFILHLVSEQYGKVIIKVPGYGKYKLYYISGAAEVPDMIAAFAEKSINSD